MIELVGAQLKNLPKILDKRGNLSVIEEFKNIPFKIARTYWIYDVPGGEKRVLMLWWMTERIEKSSH